MTLSTLDTFGDAVPLINDAFFERDQAAFANAVESAKGAVASYPTLLGKLNQAVALFPSPQALDLILQAVTEVIELERQETRQQLLQPPQFRAYSFGQSQQSPVTARVIHSNTSEQ